MQWPASFLIKMLIYPIWGKGTQNGPKCIYSNFISNLNMNLWANIAGSKLTQINFSWKFPFWLNLGESAMIRVLSDKMLIYPTCGKSTQNGLKCMCSNFIWNLNMNLRANLAGSKLTQVNFSWKFPFCLNLGESAMTRVLSDKMLIYPTSWKKYPKWPKMYVF